MYKKTTNKDRVLSQIDFVIGEMKFAIETTKDVPDESYFGTTSAGMILFRSSCMCIQNVSEGFRQIDSHTGGELLPQYKGVPWKSIKGIRNLLAHEYLSVEEPNQANMMICLQRISSNCSDGNIVWGVVWGNPLHSIYARSQ